MEKHPEMSKEGIWQPVQSLTQTQWQIFSLERKLAKKKYYCQLLNTEQFDIFLIFDKFFGHFYSKQTEKIKGKLKAQ